MSTLLKVYHSKLVGLKDIKHVSEKISEQIKEHMDPIPQVIMRNHRVDNKDFLILEVPSGTETPYYYVGDGTRIAFVRVGNESVPATAIALKRLVLKGSDKSYDSLLSEYKFKDYAFIKLKSVYKMRTHKELTDEDFISFGLDMTSGVVEAMDDKEFSGSLVTLLQSGVEFITHNTKKRWKKTATSRLEMPEYPERDWLMLLFIVIIWRLGVRFT